MHAPKRSFIDDRLQAPGRTESCSPYPKTDNPKPPRKRVRSELRPPERVAPNHEGRHRLKHLRTCDNEA